MPPTNFADYEPDANGSGWYKYKKMGKWSYHPETGLYLHIKSGVHYVQKEGDPKAFRKIEDDDDRIIRKMKQSEEMRKAIQNTEFVTFGPGEPQVSASASTDDAPRTVAAPFGSDFVEVKTAPPPEPKAEEVPAGDRKHEGKVREWNSEKGFGFIAPLGKDSTASIFVHLWNVVGSSHANPINLREGCLVSYKLGEQDGKPRAKEVVMLGKDGKPLPVHSGTTTLEEKRKSYYVTAESLQVRVHTESWPGKQVELRDRYTMDEPMEELGVYFGAFDGHGGSIVAEHAQKQLHKNILAQFRQRSVQPSSRDEKLKLAVREAFAQTDKEILGVSERKKIESQGSTALVALLHGNPKLGTALRLVLAHVGDSRAVLCRAGQAVALSEDHSPDRLDERKRVERAGGLVLQVRGSWRIAAPAHPQGMSKASRREYSGLGMTRSLGDAFFKQPTQLSTPEPECKVVPLTEKDLFLVLGTDGIYTHLSNQEVVDLALKHTDDPEEAAKTIVRTAFQKGSDDNLTAMVIQFGWADESAAKYLEKRKVMVAIGADGGSPVIKPKKGAGGDMFADASLKPADDFDMFG